MLPLQFLGQNIHFVISLFAALVFFAVFWLYFDAWTASRDNKELVKSGSFLLVALSFVLLSTVIEQPVFGKSLLGTVSEAISTILRIVGYIGIIVGQLMDPLQAKPKLEGLKESEFTEAEPATNENKIAPAVGMSGIANLSHIFLPLGTIAIAVLYWRRATTGLERHLKPVAVAFIFLSGFQILSLTSLWSSTSNTIVSRLVASFGPIWITEQALLLIGSIILGRWVWNYLTRRFMSQLFMIFITATLAIFLITTVSFTFLLVSNIQKDSLNNLQTASNVLDYAINAKKAETLADASAVTANPAIASAVETKDNPTLESLTSGFLQQKKLSSLIITGNTGQVLLRAEDPSDYGGSLSSNPLVRLALIGQSSSSISTESGVLAPVVYVTSAVPIISNGQVAGTVIVSLAADNAFVDGLKNDTGLDSTVYAGNVSSATTFVAPDGITRLIGLRSTNSAVNNTVLKQGKNFDGSISVYNRQYLAVYSPIKDINNNVVGMIFIGIPEVSVLQAAGHSVELTFLVTAILLILSIVPAYLVSKYISKQLG